MTTFRLLFTQLIYYIDLNKIILCHTDIKTQEKENVLHCLSTTHTA